MPITLSSFLLPAASVPFLSEDIHLRGGFMTVADAAARDALHLAKRKKGMIVVTQDTGEWWTIGDSINTWEPADLSSKLSLGDGFSVDGSGNIVFDGADVATEGQVFTKVGGSLVWADASVGGGGFTPTRTTIIEATGSLSQDQSENIDFAGAGNVAMIISLTVSQPDILVECFSNSARTSSNPYSFLSRTGHLTDDGTSLLEDLSTQYNRRYAFVVNDELGNGPKYYFKVTNKGATPVSTSVSINFLILQP